MTRPPPPPPLLWIFKILLILYVSMGPKVITLSGAYCTCSEENSQLIGLTKFNHGKYLSLMYVTIAFAYRFHFVNVIIKSRSHCDHIEQCLLYLHWKEESIDRIDQV